MKIIYYYFILFLILNFIIKTINSCESIKDIDNSSSNNNIINIYFNSNNGNDTIGDGSINKPYQTTCKLIEILNKETSTTNDTNITFYFGYGEYNYPNCSNIVFSNHKNIIIKSYNSSSGSTNNNNNTTNLYLNLYIENSNLNFNGNFLNLNLKSTWINYSNVIFQDNVNVNFQTSILNNNNIQNSNITIINESLLNFIISENTTTTTLNTIIVSNSIILVTERSILNNLNLDNSTELQLFVNKKSSIIGSFISMNNGYIEIIDSFLKDSKMVCGGVANISNTVITQTISSTVYDQFFDNTKSFFKLLIDGVLYIKDSKINILKNVIPYPVIYSSSKVLIELDNVEIIGYKQTTPIIRLESNVVMNMNSVHFDNCISSAVAQLEYSSLSMNASSFSACFFDSMFEIGGPSILNLHEMMVLCSDGSTFGSTIVMPTINGPFSEKSYISLENVQLECAGGFTFQNSTVSFLNVTFKANFDYDLIYLYSSSDMTLDDSMLLSTSPNSDSSMFVLVDGTLFIVNCAITFCSTTIVKASSLSMVYVDSTVVISLRLTEINAFIIQNSTINISSSTFFLNQITQPLIYSSFSTVILNNLNVSYTGSTFLQSERSNVSISFLSMTECFTQDMLFSFIYDNVTISDSIFEYNHGSSKTLFNIYESLFSVSTTTFSGNSFGPMIYSLGSVLWFDNIEFKNNSGSFLKSKVDISLKVNQFLYNNNKVPYDYIFLLENTTYVSFQDNEIIGNYINQYFIQATSLQYLEVINLTFVDNNAFSISLPSSIPRFGMADSFFQFIDCNFTKFDNWHMDNNQISLDLISIINSYGSINFDNLWFSNNIIQDDIQFVFQIQNVLNITFNNCQVLDNIGSNKVSSIISSRASNVAISNSEMSNNNFQYDGYGTVLNYDVLNYKQSIYWFQILNSNFSNNIAQYGGVFTFTSFSNTSFVNPSSKFENNIISFNKATRQGGAIYTDVYPFSLNIQEILLSNTFENNTSLNGNDFSSLMDRVEFKNNKTVINGESTLIEYEFLDYYGKVYKTFSTSLNISVTRLSTNQTDYISNSVTAGSGRFSYPFIGFVNETYIIECKLSPKYFKTMVFVLNCLPYQYYDSNKTCTYCPLNYVYIGDGNSNSSNDISSSSSSSSSSSFNEICTECDSNKLSCLFSSVFSLEGYYLINQDITNVQECAYGMCLENNTCSSKYSTGILCFECVDDNGIQVISKNGIHCCSKFKPLLLIPILIVFYSSFALFLSLFKYILFCNKHSKIGSVILFIQLNSVVFFSNSGIYILPLFRMSIDMLDGYCISKNLNYIQKSLISYSIIISLFLIGSTDITLKIIQFIYKKINNNNNNNNNSNNLIIYPNFINNIINSKKEDEVYNVKSIWSLFQIFIIPLVFNSVSLIYYKNLNNQSILSVDFSITKSNQFNQFLIFISILILILISLFLIILLLITLKSATATINEYSNISSGDSLLDRNPSVLNLISNYFKNLLNKLYKLPKSFYYKKQFKWWDSILIIKSILYSILSITMLFQDNEYYLAAVLSIQLAYTTLYILVCPIRTIRSPKDLNNLINLIELLILIIADSELFKTIITDFYRGLSLTIIIFTFSLILILFDYIDLKKLNDKNSKFIYSKIPTLTVN